MAIKRVAVCTACWIEREGNREPVRVKRDEEPPEQCHHCGRPTLAGIYQREQVLLEQDYEATVGANVQGFLFGYQQLGCLDCGKAYPRTELERQRGRCGACAAN